ncbi:MAG: L-threonylcarbamoyladenylate synthase, partial [Pseudomonadota bacterium]
MTAEKNTIRLSPTDRGLRVAKTLLSQGGLVAFPTETVYGLGADARNDKAVAGIYAAKGRPSFNPLIIHVASLEAARLHADFTPEAEALAAAFWPGPLTLILPRSAQSPVSPLASGGLQTVALRVPAHPLAHQLLEAFAGPIAAPSANPSGRISPTHADHVMEGLT